MCYYIGKHQGIKSWKLKIKNKVSKTKMRNPEKNQNKEGWWPVNTKTATSGALPAFFI